MPSIIVNNLIEIDWYHKSTFSGRYLNFKSNHPHYAKKETVIDLVDRAFLLSTPKIPLEKFRIDKSTSS